MKTRRLLGLTVLLVAALAAACGQTTEPTPHPTPEPTVAQTPVPTVADPTSTPEPPDDRPLVDVSHLLDFVREGIYRNSDGVGGAAWLDYDGDGFLDLYITNTRDEKNALFRNNGDGTFTNVAEQAGVTSETGNTAVVAGDIDNDGCTDLLMSGDGGFIGDEPSSFKVYRNDCDGTFTDITESIGLDALSDSYSWAFALADIDNDSDLDLYVGGPPGPGFDFGPPNRLFLNGGDGEFMDISASAEVIDDLPTCGVGFNDYDEDGFIDIFLASCVWLDARFRLLRNNGDLTFSDVSFKSGLSLSIEGLPGHAEHDFRLGVAFSDYDSDGDLDILSRNYGSNGPVFENTGDGTYIAVGYEATFGDIGYPTSWAFGVADFDNDGGEDIFYSGNFPVESFDWPANAGLLLLNRGDGSFRKFPSGFGLEDLFTTGTAIGDYDNDGFADIVVVTSQSRGQGGEPVLLHNQGGSNSWVSVRLIGTASNRDGIGARVWAKADDTVVVKSTHAGSGFLSTNSPLLTFGLGDRDGPIDIEVRWPSGLVEMFEDQAIKQIVTLTEGTGTEIESGG